MSIHPKKKPSNTIPHFQNPFEFFSPLWPLPCLSESSTLTLFVLNVCPENLDPTTVNSSSPASLSVLTGTRGSGTFLGTPVICEYIDGADNVLKGLSLSLPFLRPRLS
jgi:hypothetical protein